MRPAWLAPSCIAALAGTTAVIGGLPADYDRVYEMRAAAEPVPERRRACSTAW